MSRQESVSDSDEHDETDADSGSEPERSANKNVVRAELDRLREFMSGISGDDLTSGKWFEKLLYYSLRQYSKQVDAEYFRTKYPDLPPDEIADARIALAANYASIEGGLSSAAYSATISATIGSLGGASPLTLPAAGTAFVVDLAYTSQLQLKLAFDLAVIYGVPLDVEDPEDLWKLVRIAFAIKSGEVSGEVVLRGVPLVVRPMVKKIVSGSTLATMKSLPVVGKHLLQRNVIKFAIPGVAIPLTVGINYWSTRIAGRQSKDLFRREARLVELAATLVKSTTHVDDLPWVLLWSMRADGSATPEQSSLLHYVSVRLRSEDRAQETLDATRSVVDVDESAIRDRLRSRSGDLSPPYGAAVSIAAVRGKISSKSHTHLTSLAVQCGIAHDKKSADEKAKSWR